MAAAISTHRLERDTGVRISTDPRPPVLFTALTGLVALAVVLQGIWAGIFLEHDGQRDAAASWIEVHARGGEVALALAVLAAVLACVKLRSRLDLLAGSVALVALLVAESFIGGLIRDEGKDTLTAIHVPLAMAIMALTVWLPLRSSRRHTASHRN
jgi:hypothetical protein